MSNKSTLIDNIFVNKPEKLNFAGILNDEISDHQAIVNDLNVVLPPQRTVYVTIFSNSEHSIQSFKNDFECKNIYEKLNKDLNADPNKNYAMLEAAITESMNAHLEKKIVKFNRKKHKKDPWMTYGILKSVNHKNKLYKNLMKINKDLPLFDNKKQEFNVYKNTLRRLINQAKNIYFSTQFEKNRGDGKKTWQTIDNALHRKNPTSTPDAIVIDGALSTNTTEMAESFNNYFSTVCKLNEADEPNLPPHTRYLKNPSNTVFKFEQINNATVVQYINKLKSSHS